MASSISVIICAYSMDRGALLREALDSLLLQQTAASEILVVIDHNSELERLVSKTCRSIRTLANQGPPGLSAARNTGLEAAAGEILAFLDDDAVAQPDWVSGLLRHYRRSEVIGVGGSVIPLWPSKRPIWFPEEFDWVVGCSYRGQPTQVAVVRNLFGANMSFRRNVFDRIGRFTEGLGREGGNGGGCEETEFCIRASRAFPDSRIVYDPAIVVRHHVSAERTRWRYFRARCLAEGRSKRAVVRRIGSEGVSTERRHAMRVLPAGMLRGFSDALFKGDLNGLARSGAIAAGLLLVTASYLGVGADVQFWR